MFAGSGRKRTPWGRSDDRPSPSTRGVPNRYADAVAVGVMVGIVRHLRSRAVRATIDCEPSPILPVRRPFAHSFPGRGPQ
jgi:hypothetical protein